MRYILADFSRLEDRPEWGWSIVLGSEKTRPDLQDLTDEDPVILIEPENLVAPGIVRHADIEGQRFWFGILTGPITDAPAIAS